MKDFTQYLTENYRVTSHACGNPIVMADRIIKIISDHKQDIINKNGIGFFKKVENAADIIKNYYYYGEQWWRENRENSKKNKYPSHEWEVEDKRINDKFKDMPNTKDAVNAGKRLSKWGNEGKFVFDNNTSANEDIQLYGNAIVRDKGKSIQDIFNHDDSYHPCIY